MTNKLNYCVLCLLLLFGCNHINPDKHNGKNDLYKDIYENKYLLELKLMQKFSLDSFIIYNVNSERIHTKDIFAHSNDDYLIFIVFKKDNTCDLCLKSMIDTVNHLSLSNNNVCLNILCNYNQI